MRRSLLNKQILSKPLRQALVLFTLLLLPSAAWGIEVIKTITFNKEVTTVSDDAINNSTIPVSVSEEIGGKEYNYNSRAIITHENTIENYSCSSNEGEGATFTLKNGVADNATGFRIQFPGTYPAEPSSVKISFAYANTDDDADVYTYCAVIGVSEIEANQFHVPSTTDGSHASLSSAILFTDEGNVTDFGTLKTTRPQDEELDIWVYLNAKEDKTTTFTITEIEIRYDTDFYLSVAGIPVTGVNANDILGDGKVSFAANTLTLDNAILSDGIEYKGSDDLTIALNDDSKLSYIKYVEGTASGTPQLLFTKATGATDCSLEINSESVISGFSNVDFGPFGTISSGPIGYGEPNPQESFICLLNPVTKDPITNVVITTGTTYPLWIAGKQATAGDLTGDEFQSGDNTFNTITNVSFTPGSTNILSFNNGGITTRGEVAKLPAIISNLDNLTIQFTGENSISLDDLTQNPSPIKSLNSEASITFTSSAEGASLSCTMGSAAFTDGFKTVNYENGLGCLMTSGYKKIQKMTLNSPTISTSEYEGDIKINFNNELGSYYDGIHYFYKIDYADSSIEDPEEVELPVNSAYYIEPETPLLLSSLTSPCTITAYAKFNTTTSTANKAKLFAIADKTIVFNDDTKGTELTVNDFEIIPATEGEGVSFKIRGVNNSDVIEPSTEGSEIKYSIAGIGRCEVSVEIINNPTINPTIQVLNPIDNPSVSEVIYVKGVVTVVPSAPSFSIEEKEEYLNTDKVELIMPEEMLEDQNASIRYSWVENEVGGTEYNSDSKVQLNAGTGTLYAWVRYNQTDADPILSEKVSMTFENVKINIDQFSVKNMLEESPAYQGSAISIPFTLYDPKVETTTISAENYDVIYKKYVGGDEGYETVESVVDVGTYIVSIKGKGSYGGEKLIYENLVVTQASLADAAISKLIVGEKEYEYDADKDIEIPYTGEAIQPDVVVVFNDGTVTVDASEYTISYGENNTDVSAEASASVTVTSTGKNFEEGTSTSLNFKIVPAPVTITATQQTVTYNTNAQEYDISKVEVSNDKAKLAVTYYATEEDRANGENALTGDLTDAGTYYVRVTLNEESLQHYVAEPADATFTIEQLDISDISQEDITLDNNELTYNGEQQTVNVTKVMAGNIEVPIDCYEVTGNTGTEAGDYKLIVKAKTEDGSGNVFKNNFTGSAEKNWKINHRTASPAELGFKSETQTASTYYNPEEDFNLPDGYVAYIITGINGTEVLTTCVSYIPMGVAVLVEKGTSSDNAIDEVDNRDILPLKGTFEPLGVSEITGGTVYVLYNGEFVKSTSGTIPAKRCYLLIESTVAAGTRSFSINHGDGSTGIDSALIYDNDENARDKWHDLQGRGIEKPTKAGLYIKNGKKVVIK